MKRLTSLARSAALALLIASPASAFNQVWVVADTLCPDADFDSIQAAVDAASDGDTILVRRAPVAIDRTFEIVQKSLTIIRATDNFLFNANVVGGDATVRDLLPDQSVTLIGVGGFPTGTLLLKDNQGAVYIDRVAYGGPNAPSVEPPYYEPVRIENCTDVTFTGCSWRAPDYDLVDCLPGDPCLSVTGPTGTVVINSEVQFFNCSMSGGEGGPGYDPFNLGTSGGVGGPGIRLENSTITLFATSVFGGEGGTNNQNLPAPFCANGGDGGPAIYFADAASQVRLQDSNIVGGAGGLWTETNPIPNGCSDGGSGALFAGPGHTNVSFLPGETRKLLAESVFALIEGELSSLKLEGEPGDLVFLGVGLEQDSVYLPAFGATSLFTPLTILKLGKLNASGKKTVPIVPGDVVNPGESVTVLLQSYSFDLGLQVYYSTPTAIALLDSSHDAADGCATTFYVDDDAPNDPGPNDFLVSDPLEDGTLAHPYDSISEAIQKIALSLPVTVQVADGNYESTGLLGIGMAGRLVSIESENGPDNCTVTAVGSQNVFRLTETAATPVQGLRGFTITGATGGGIRIDNSAVTIENCIVEGNTGTNGGGIRLQNSTATISNCIVRDNVASGRGGGIYAVLSQPTIINCEVVDNTAPEGAGITLDTSLGNSTTVSQGLIRNCTVANNIGIGVYYRTAAMFTGTNEGENLLVWGNVGGIQVQVKNGTLLLDYANVQGGAAGVFLETTAVLTPGPGFLDLDPLFVDAMNGDYHLTLGSPCIDAGDPAFVAAPGETDIDGDARVQGAAVDLGSDEL